MPLLVLTHFHADHVDGLPGVLDGRHVDQVLVTPVGDPPAGVAQVSAEAAAAGVDVAVAAYGETRTVGPVTLQVLWPPGPDPLPGDGSVPNNASLVVLVQVGALSLLLTGDIEPEAQRSLARSLAGLQVDVLKVPHHGSRHQDLDFLTGLRPRLAVVSVGEDNDYGHPAPDLLRALAAAGVEVERTDLDGDVLVVDRDGRLLTQTSR